jgi:hypothetical protein
MILRNKDQELAVTCDFCSSEEYESETTNWWTFLKEIRDKGWLPVKEDLFDEWVHFCPACRED